MGLFDSIFGGGQDAAGQAQAAGNRQAQAYLSPYRNSGLQDYEALRKMQSQKSSQLGNYGGMEDYAWNSAGMTPQEGYASRMEGYTESPQTQYEKEQMEKAAYRAAAASGMAGSGSYFDSILNQTNDIVKRGEDSWLNRMLGIEDQNFKYLGNFQNQEMNNSDILKYLTQLGYGAAGGSGQYAIGEGNANAQSALGNSSALTSALGLGLNFNPIKNKITEWF